MLAIVLIHSLGSSDRVQLVYPENGAATESYTINLVGLVRGRGHRKVVISVNGRSQMTPIADSSFQSRNLQLKPGLN